MANIELVIKIPEGLKKDFELEQWTALSCMEMKDALMNSTLLPKGHGRLKDENYLLSILRCEEYETCTWRNCSECNREKCIKVRDIVTAPTVIEADNAESEE